MNVAARVAELKGRVEKTVVANVVYDRQTIIKGLFDLIELARESGQFGVVRAAYVDLGKDIGMFVDRSVNVNLNADLELSWRRRPPRNPQGGCRQLRRSTAAVRSVEASLNGAGLRGTSPRFIIGC